MVKELLTLMLIHISNYAYCQSHTSLFSSQSGGKILVEGSDNSEHRKIVISLFSKNIFGKYKSNESKKMLEMSVIKKGDTLSLVPNLISIFADGNIECNSNETPIFILADSVGAQRIAYWQNCYSYLTTVLKNKSTLNGVTVYEFSMNFSSSASHIPYVSGIIFDKSLSVMQIKIKYYARIKGDDFSFTKVYTPSLKNK